MRTVAVHTSRYKAGYSIIEYMAQRTDYVWILTSSMLYLTIKTSQIAVEYNGLNISHMIRTDLAKYKPH